jgi:hypothetical protein
LIEFSCEQQASTWRCVIAGKICEFFGEVLKAQADAEARFVLFKELTRLLDVGLGGGLSDSEHGFQKQKKGDRIAPVSR